MGIFECFRIKKNNINLKSKAQVLDFFILSLLAEWYQNRIYKRNVKMVVNELVFFLKFSIIILVRIL